MQSCGYICDKLLTIKNKGKVEVEHKSKRKKNREQTEADSLSRQIFEVQISEVTLNHNLLKMFPSSIMSLARVPCLGHQLLIPSWRFFSTCLNVI